MPFDDYDLNENLHCTALNLEGQGKTWAAEPVLLFASKFARLATGCADSMQMGWRTTYITDLPAGCSWHFFLARKGAASQTAVEL